MLENLFTKVGEKLKSVAVIGFVLECVGAVIGACIAADGAGAYGFVIFVLVLVGGIAAALFASWLLYGYGQLIETAEHKDENMKSTLDVLTAIALKQGVELKKEEEKPAPIVYANVESPAPVQPKIAPAPVKREEKVNKKDSPAVEAIIEGNEKICPHCHTRQQLTRTVCWSCGQKFSN